MVFFTPYYKKLRNGIRLAAVFSLISVCSIAFAASSIEIKQAELQPLDDFYALSAEVEVSFDDTIEAAVNKGVPLQFLIEFQVVRPHKYWFDDEIVTASRSVVLSYHALSRQYLVTRGAHQKSFESLEEAAQELMIISDWKVLDKALVEKNESYNAALLVRLDQSKLPKAIQVDAISSEKWNLTSQKFEWALKELWLKEPLNKDAGNKELK
ncbi:MAG: DUF4390 domain-containing protein [Pseudomonadota bacterium]